MTQTVRGVISRKKGEPVELVDVVIPDPGPGEVRVRIVRAGVGQRAPRGRRRRLRRGHAPVAPPPCRRADGADQHVTALFLTPVLFNRVVDEDQLMPEARAMNALK